MEIFEKGGENVNQIKCFKKKRCSNASGEIMFEWDNIIINYIVRLEAVIVSSSYS